MARIIGTAGSAPKARKVVVKKSSPPPKTDVQSSGGDYGTKKATAFKRTAVYKREVGSAKPQRMTDATSSGPGYGAPKAKAYNDRVARAHASVAAALSKKPFNAAHIADAIALGIAPKKLSIVNGRVVLHAKASLLGVDSLAQDGNLILDPKNGGIKTLDKYDKGDLKTNSQLEGAAKAGAPVGQILSQTARPIHAIAGLATAGPHGFTQGLLHNKPYTFGKLLKSKGVPGAVAGVAGFGLDVGLDPTTYVTGGASSVERAAVEKAAVSTAKKAERAGMSESGVKTVVRAAEKKAAAAAPEGKGVSVKFAGRQVPGVTTGTAKAAKVVKKAGGKAPKSVKSVGSAVRGAATDVRPQLAGAGESQAEHVAVRRAGRQARAEARVGMAEAERHARALKRLVPADQYENVISAIERNKLGELPKELQQTARQVRDSMRHAKRVRQQAGIREGDVTKAAPVQDKVAAAKEGLARGHAAALTDQHVVGLRNQLRGMKGNDPRVADVKAALASSIEELAALRQIPGDDPLRLTLANAEDAYQSRLVKLDGLRQREGNPEGASAAGPLLRDRTKELEQEVAALRAQRDVAAKRWNDPLGKKPKAVKRDGAAVNYFPHALADEVKPGQGIHETAVSPAAKGVRKVRLASSKQRTDLRPISVQNPERVAAGETPFSTNLPLVHGEYMAGTAKGVAARNLARQLADAGRPLKDGMALGADDTVFHFHNGDLTPLKAVPKNLGNGRYVVLNKKTVEREFANIAPQADRTHIGAIFDRGTAAFKRIATLTPGFHARNAVGDTQMAYLAQPGHLLPRNASQASRAVKRLSKVEAEQSKTLTPLAKTTATIKVAGKPHNVDDFLAEAQKHGVIRSGYVGRELREQGKGVGRTTRVGGKVTDAGHRVNRWMQNREDLMRLATYKHGLDSGLSPAEAADLSLGVHIDYGDLTKFERSTARRALPFYTFSARALPIHATALVTRPGKYANIEKAREETATATGLNLDEEQKKLKIYQARQAPLILKLGGKTTVISDSLPLTLLNEIPTSANPGKSISELSQWMAGMLSPILKDPAELYANRSFFFRSDIQNQARPLVSAPDWVATIYKHDRPLARKLGIVPDYFDKKSGRKVWGWPGKTDYFAKAIPGLPNLLQQLTTQGTNRRGQGEAQKILGGVLGVKAEPLDPEGALIEALYPKLNQVTAQLGAMNQRGIKAANATPEYRRLSQEQKDIKASITKLSASRGDKVPLYSKSVKRSPSLGSSGNIGGGIGGGGIGGGIN